MHRGINSQVESINTQTVRIALGSARSVSEKVSLVQRHSFLPTYVSSGILGKMLFLVLKGRAITYCLKSLF